MSVRTAGRKVRHHLKAGDFRDRTLGVVREGRVVETIRRQILTRPRTLSSAPGVTSETHSARRLNFLAREMRQCTTYLEIGVEAGSTLENVVVPFRWGVDPVPTFSSTPLPPGLRFSYATSDTFFQELAPNVFFDLVFLDGLHEWRQTYKDLLNALRHTSRRSLILIDDVVPDDAHSAIPNQAKSMAAKRAAGISSLRWHGDVYKTIVAVVENHPELDFRIIGDASLDNLQAILWRVDDSPVKMPDPAVLDRVDQLDYDDVFVGGELPESFNYVEEQVGLRLALDATVEG